jgi:hypothetical protein
VKVAAVYSENSEQEVPPLTVRECFCDWLEAAIGFADKRCDGSLHQRYSRAGSKNLLARPLIVETAQREPQYEVADVSGG